MMREHAIGDAIALSLLQSLWQDALLAATAACVLTLQSRASASARHTTALSFLLAMAAAPLLTFAHLVAGQDSAASVLSVARAQPLLPLRAGALVLAAPSWLAWCWAAGVALMLARLAGGWWLISALDRTRSHALPRLLVERCEALRRSMRIRRQVAIRLLDDIAQPFSARVVRPVVWLPVAMMAHLPIDQIEALIAHELAHIRRLDWIWNGLQCVVEALLFYHPAVWWLSRRVRRERENACDDLAVEACGDAIVLAEALGALEGVRGAAPLLSLSANGGSLMKRVTRLLCTEPRSCARWGVPLGLVAVLCSGTLLAASLAPGIPPSAFAGATFEAPSGPFGTGNSRTYRERTGAGLKEYQRRVDRLGRVSETITLDGQPLPIDAGARAWIAQKEADLHQAALPPSPPLPRLAAVQPQRVILRDSPAYRAAVALAQRSPRLVAELGAPIVGTGAVRGRLSDANLFGPADADLQIGLTGPKSAAVLEAKGELDAGEWQFSRLFVTPDRGTSIELATQP